MNYPQKIMLIGMPGAGKSTVGRQVAKRLGIHFFDLDREIEKIRGWSISDIFAQLGEDYFRELEQLVLQMLITLHKPCLIATGGGTAYFYDNINQMLKAGPTIFLNTPINVIIARVKSTKGSRPLVNAINDANLDEKMKVLFQKRLPFYEKASFTSDSKIDEIIAYLANHAYAVETFTNVNLLPQKK